METADGPGFDLMVARDLVGFLNFSEGAFDPKFYGNLNLLFCQAAGIDPEALEGYQLLNIPPGLWRKVRRVIQEAIEQAPKFWPDFGATDQAACVVRVVFDELLPAYREFHQDLLAHQTDDFLFQPFFLARAFEAVLKAGDPWEETERIVQAALGYLNDFVGYRPIPVLETRKLEPYAHERLCPIPLYIRGAGVALCRFAPLIHHALKSLSAASEEILQHAAWDRNQLVELAVDPRFYDFQHPVNFRPNYIYGTWDLHRLDGRGAYCRYVLQQIFLEGLCEWLAHQEDFPSEAAMFAAATVVAGTMLMGGGISGGYPHARSSTDTLSRLVEEIARYRDLFYEQALAAVSPEFAAAFKRELERYQQPFGSVRQRVNRWLAQQRAEQRHRASLASFLADFGDFEAVEEQLKKVPSVSARMLAQIEQLIQQSRHAALEGRLEEAVRLLPQMVDVLHRAIGCGAMVDPWNVLGFAGRFPIGPAPEESTSDERISTLIRLVEDIFQAHAELLKCAAARGRDDLRDSISRAMEELAAWWDQFATTTVEEIVSFSGRSAWQSAVEVADVLGLWHKAGAAAGDLGFWRQHVDRFRSCKAYAAVVETLLDHGDLIASMNLLIDWLSRAEEVHLSEGSQNFHKLAARWLHELWKRLEVSGDSAGQQASSDAPTIAVGQGTLGGQIALEQCWRQSIRFLELLEANAESYWSVPTFNLATQKKRKAKDIGECPPEELEDFLRPFVNEPNISGEGFGEIDVELLDQAFEAVDAELLAEAKRLIDRVLFLMVVATLWCHIALRKFGHPELQADETLSSWHKQAKRFAEDLEELVKQINQYKLELTSLDLEGIIRYHQQVGLKTLLIERVSETLVSMTEAAWLLGVITQNEGSFQSKFVSLAQKFLTELIGGKGKFPSGLWRRLCTALMDQPLTYRRLSANSPVDSYIQSQLGYGVLEYLISFLPRRGYLRQTCELLEAILESETSGSPPGQTISEFDRLLKKAAKALLEVAISNAERWAAGDSGMTAEDEIPRAISRVDAWLQSLWERNIERLVITSATLLEDPRRWQMMCDFIRQVGDAIFNQEFLSYANLEAIRNLGGEKYIEGRLLTEADDEAPQFLKLRSSGFRMAEVARMLEVLADIICESYSHYIDYNSSTTKSDRGSNLYVLLDFLRLVAKVEEHVWRAQLRVILFGTLLRMGHVELANQLESELVADDRESLAVVRGRLKELESRYAINLRTVETVIEDGLVYQLQLEKLKWLIRVIEARKESEEGEKARAEFLEILDWLVQRPRCTGYEVPHWVRVLEEELQNLQWPFFNWIYERESLIEFRKVTLNREEFYRQLK